MGAAAAAAAGGRADETMMMVRGSFWEGLAEATQQKWRKRYVSGCDVFVCSVLCKDCEEQIMSTQGMGSLALSQRFTTDRAAKKGDHDKCR